MHSNSAKTIGFAEEQCAELGLTDAPRVSQYRFENRLKFGGRGADDLKYLRGCRLLF
jgi:hypothetical protein